MADKEGPSTTISSKKTNSQDENITSDAASKVVSVELNKKRIKAKENEQDPIPSDDEYLELDLDPEELAKRKKELMEKACQQNS